MTAYHEPSFARTYADATRQLDTSHLRSRFLARLPDRSDPPPRLLDLGCGAGRDARAFREAGYRVDAMDASAAMVKIAREHAGVPVRVLRAQEIEDTEAYDGIWACASLLHVPWDELREVFRRLERALRPGGVLYASFKPGERERTLDDGRRFTDMTEARIRDRLRDAPELRVIEVWETPDVRPERTHERWLNVLLRREPRPWRLDPPRRIATTRVFDVNARRARSAANPEKSGEFFSLDCPDWANVIAVTPDRRVVLIEQFRFGIEAVTLEIPGGIVDPGESPAAACRRELLEETGYAGDEVRMIGRVSGNPAIQNNFVHTGLVMDARLTGAVDLDPFEEIDVRLVPLADIPRLIRTGAIHHAFVVAAFQHLSLIEP